MFFIKKLQLIENVQEIEPKDEDKTQYLKYILKQIILFQSFGEQIFHLVHGLIHDDQSLFNFLYNRSNLYFLEAHLMTQVHRQISDN